MLWNKRMPNPRVSWVGLMAGLSLSAAQAAYLQWETVELPASSGASCGNGTPYRFFVNRTPFTSKTVVVFEGGGACFGQNTCLGLPLPTNDPKHGVLPRFICEPFFPDILQAPVGPQRDALIMTRWRQDVNAWVGMVQTKAPSNLGYYIPNARDIALSHTLTCVTFAGTAIPELNMPSVGSFIDDLIDGSRPVTRAQTSVQTMQRSGLAAIYLGIADLLLAVLGA